MIDENYERWLSNPQSVDPDWAAFFEGFELGFAKSEENGETATAELAPGTLSPTAACKRESRRSSMPTERLVIPSRISIPSICSNDRILSSALKELGFEERELDLTVSSRFFREGKKMKLRDMIRELEAIYCGTVGAEFMHIQNPRMRTWVLYKLENRDASAAHQRGRSPRYPSQTLRGRDV